MALDEGVIVRQNSSYQIEILALDVHGDQAHEGRPVEDVRHLTPYGMLLAALGSCTASVLLTYAEHHGVELDEVELRLTYGRVYGDECKDCDAVHEYGERIDEEIVLVGELSEQDRKKLFAVSKHCPIHKMLLGGIEIESKLAEEPAAGDDQSR
ncbi:MAG: OsmC family peroxiredoxin [Anaerolineales bacterium]|nr:MAG: OsmC family peroxiredoxin [Anaerolineales bacterium]